MNQDPHDHLIRTTKYRKTPETESALIAINNYLSAYISLPAPDVQSKYPLIFIVGVPRSGTTLLSQLLSKYFHVGYINNIVARFWANPVVGIYLSNSILGPDARTDIDLRSEHGTTLQPCGPHEFGYYWRYWLNLDNSTTHHLTKDHLSQLDTVGLYQSLLSITSVFRAPVVFKNIICGFQARFIQSIYPDSIFIYIQRDVSSVQKSILRCRTERYGSPSAWWSLKPSTYDSICKINTPSEQVLMQILDSRSEFEDELKGTHSIVVDYEALCKCPSTELARIHSFVNTLGFPLAFADNPSNIVL